MIAFGLFHYFTYGGAARYPVRKVKPLKATSYSR